MEKNILNAFERTTKSKRFKENGFIAGVIYGDNVKEATSVKFEESSLRKILGKHGSNAKVWVKYGEGKKFGFIKEIQRHPVTAKITHIDVQLVSKNHEIKLQLPIEFKGEKNLVANLLKLNIQKTEIDVFGKMALMPDVVVIDVSEKELGDTITIKNFNLDKEIKISDNEDEIYATITRLVEENNAESEEEVAE
ncbi:50S ribosomal protein L25 [Clostridium gasigenes]|uniref:50S ribosomal protein L25 n=1 Tax=Clostridium gasigenes TaxID=94869 RepID=A0A7X0VQ47_9CLOT|nr:50S ribosomal protein L25 [Clostridium gasigenes]MBB6624537.1 50S ribosomal protein L25 [Clostridium gasigenes]MBB6713175.1 50S ribosomal protein L25 [Clostridium gasigenes]